MDSDSDAIPREPPVAGNELDTLLGALERQRGYVAWPRRSPPAAWTGSPPTLGSTAGPQPATAPHGHDRGVRTPRGPCRPHPGVGRWACRRGSRVMTPSTTTREPITTAQLTITAANKASWADLQAIFGTADYPGKCYCQHFKTRDCHWSSISDRERQNRLREQTHCDNPRARTSTGLVAYLGKEPAGWVAVEPRTAYPRLQRIRTV